MFSWLQPTLLLVSVPGVALAQPSETDIPYSGSATFIIGSETLRLEGQRVLKADGTVLVSEIYAPPVWDNNHLCVVDSGGGLGRLRCWDAHMEAVTLATGGFPTRLALGGTMVAWVASPHTLPQVFVGPVNGTGPNKALTNVDLLYIPGQAPEGFVPPPLGQSLRFEGDQLRWDSPEGPKAVQWR